MAGSSISIRLGRGSWDVHDPPDSRDVVPLATTSLALMVGYRPLDPSTSEVPATVDPGRRASPVVVVPVCSAVWGPHPSLRGHLRLSGKHEPRLINFLPAPPRLQHLPHLQLGQSGLPFEPRPYNVEPLLAEMGGRSSHQGTKSVPKLIRIGSLSPNLLKDLLRVWVTGRLARRLRSLGLVWHAQSAPLFRGE